MHGINGAGEAPIGRTGPRMCGKEKARKTMPSDETFVMFIVDNIENAGIITYKKMFGEYAIYSDGKVVALLCDNQLFVKRTEGGRSFMGDVVEASPYPGAKSSFLIGDTCEDKAWISALIRITAEELPIPKPKKKSKRTLNRD
jgi:TfoX/Sxy family transcriptional regulator of competence genes